MKAGEVCAQSDTSKLGASPIKNLARRENSRTGLATPRSGLWPEVTGSRWAALKRQQPFVMALDRLVALARTLFQLLQIHEMNVAPPILDKPRLLQRARHH